MVWLSADDAKTLGFADNGVSPPTAEIKLSGQTPYLKLEQAFPDVGTRLLLICAKGELLAMGGIVTTPEATKERLGELAPSARTYLEFDDAEELVEDGRGGLSAEGSVLFLDRKLDTAHAKQLLKTKSLGIWTESGESVLRWGTYIDLQPVRAQILEFMANCSAPSRWKADVPH